MTVRVFSVLRVQGDGAMVLLWLNGPGRWDDGRMLLLLLKFMLRLVV
jgi:hypothetical protein